MRRRVPYLYNYYRDNDLNTVAQCSYCRNMSNMVLYYCLYEILPRFLVVLQNLISPAWPRCSHCLCLLVSTICTSFHWPSGPMCMVGSIACNARCYQTKFCSCRRGWGRSNKDHDSLCRYAWRAYWKVGEIYSCTVAYNTVVNSRSCGQWSGRHGSQKHGEYLNICFSTLEGPFINLT